MRNIFGVLLITIGVFGAAFGQCSDADKKALEAFDHAWGAASVGGDRAAKVGERILVLLVVQVNLRPQIVSLPPVRLQLDRLVAATGAV